MTLGRRLRLRYGVPLASHLPERVLSFLDRYWPLDRDPADGWSFWMDASYLAWTRTEEARLSAMTPGERSWAIHRTMKGDR